MVRDYDGCIYIDVRTPCGERGLCIPVYRGEKRLDVLLTPTCFFLISVVLDLV